MVSVAWRALQRVLRACAAPRMLLQLALQGVMMMTCHGVSCMTISGSISGDISRSHEVSDGYTGVRATQLTVHSTSSPPPVSCEPSVPTADRGDVAKLGGHDETPPPNCAHIPAAPSAQHLSSSAPAAVAVARCPFVQSCRHHSPRRRPCESLCVCMCDMFCLCDLTGPPPPPPHPPCAHRTVMCMH